MKRVVVTGATSMMGIAFLNQCIKNHVEVLALVRPKSLKLNCLPQSDLIQIMECDLKNIITLQISNNRSYDALYHFGWAYTEHENRNNVILQNENVQLTLDVVFLAHRLGCETFIGAGSQAEYGRVDHTISTKEPINPDSAYGVAKYAAGKQSAILCKQLGIHHIWGRIFSTYGFYDNRNTMLMYCIDSLLKSRKPSFTKCEQQWDYIFCEDAARAFYLMGDKGKDQAIYNVGSGQERQLYEYISILHQIINPDIPLGIGEKDYGPSEIMYLRADISNLTKDTGFVPQISFEVGAVRTIKWYKEEFL